MLFSRVTCIFPWFGRFCAQVDPVKITYGINTQDKDSYGMMLYHRNRLIKPYLKVGIQTQANYQGRGVVGIIEADFLQPTHNKQDFDYTQPYRLCINKLAEGLKIYWRELQQQKQRQQQQMQNSAVPVPPRPDEP